MLRQIESILHLFVHLVSGDCIGIRDEDLGDERFHSQGLAEFFSRDLGFVEFVAVQSEH
jgi:hypothetical protein